MTLRKVKVTRRSGEAYAGEAITEAGRTASVSYGPTQVLTAHGLKLLATDLGMETALDLLCKNADEEQWPSVIETPPELYKDTRCAGLIVRPSSWNYETCTQWMHQEGAALISHFGHEAHFGFLPELFEEDSQ